MLYKKLFKLYNTDNTLFITPNNRLSRYLQTEYSQYQIINNKLNIWPALSSKSWDSWCLELWELSTVNKLLLTPLQSKLIAERIINKLLSNYHGLINLDSTSYYLIQAKNLLISWNLDYEKLEPELLFNFINNYNKTIKKLGFIDSGEIINYLINLNLADIISIKNLVLVAVDEITPNMQNLLDYLKNININIYFENQFKILEKSNNIKIITADNLSNEIDNIINWVKISLKSKPNIQLGVIVPNLNTIRDLLYQKFNENFADRQFWNISGGVSLSSVPVVKSAVYILKLLAHRKISYDNLKFILTSPYYSNFEQEKITKEVIILKLINYTNAEISLDNLLKFLANYKIKFYNNLQASYNYLNKFSTKKLLPSAWVPIIFESLLLIQWPGNNRIIDSLEYQAINIFNNILMSSKQLDIIYGNINLIQYLQYLIKLVNNREFQIETNQAQVNILGVLEGAGLAFDKLWFMNLTDDIWPQVAAPNPFIPSSLQIDNNMPHSSPERELEFSEKITNRILNSSKNIILSYSKKENEKLLYPSYFIKKFLNNNIKNFKLTNNSQYNITLDKITDNNAKSINNKYLSQGINAIKLQILCPFRAFAETRLKAKPLAQYDISSTALDRGIVIHTILEKIWDELKNQDNLLKLTKSGEISLINKYINIVLNNLQQQKPRQYFDNFIFIEKKRLFKIIFKALQLEKQRSNFQVIHLETEKLINIADISFKVRIDRIDKLADNKNIIIDYKTSVQNINFLLYGDYLLEPQLAIYSVYNTINNISGVFYNIINLKLVDYTGIINNTSFYSDVNNNSKIINLKTSEHWQDLNTNWDKQVKQALDDYKQGIAVVKPISANISCRTCNLQNLCRIYE